MNYRKAFILAEKAIGTTATETMDIRIQKPISRITIAWRVTKGQHIMTAHPAGDMLKIELVDGSDVLHSLDGYINQALCIYDRKVPTMCNGQHIAPIYEYSWYGIDFGRYLYDPLLAFDPTRFVNPQLKITHNRAICDSAATAAHLEVIAECFDEKVISPIGFLMSKEHYKYTPSTVGTYQYIDLPTDYPYRQLLIRPFEIKYDSTQTILAAKLDEDNDSKIPFDFDLEDYNRMNRGVDLMVSEPCVGYVGGDELLGVYYLTPTDTLNAIIGQGHGAAGCLIGVTTHPRGGWVNVRSNDTNMFVGMAQGWIPNHTIRFPFGLQNEIDDWYDVTKVENLRLRLQAGTRGSSGTCQVAIQQLRKY